MAHGEWRMESESGQRSSIVLRYGDECCAATHPVVPVIPSQPPTALGGRSRVPTPVQYWTRVEAKLGVVSQPPRGGRCFFSSFGRFLHSLAHGATDFEPCLATGKGRHGLRLLNNQSYAPKHRRYRGTARGTRHARGKFKSPFWSVFCDQRPAAGIAALLLYPLSAPRVSHPRPDAFGFCRPRGRYQGARSRKRPLDSWLDAGLTSRPCTVQY